MPQLTGTGLNVWPHVHVSDVGSHFSLIYSAALTNTAPHGEDGYFLCTAGEYRLIEVAKVIGESMLQTGFTDTSETLPFTGDELDEYSSGVVKIGGSKRYSGTNSRAISAG